MNVPMAPPQAPRSTVADPTSLLDRRLLIADDDPLYCQLLGEILHKKGFKNLCYANGGFSTLEQVESWQPDLVLLDNQMPDLGGLEVCKRIRAQRAYIDIPILMQTATVDRRQMGILFAAGASDFLSKPINPSELISRVTIHLERRFLLRELREYRERMSGELDAARQMQLEMLPSAAAQEAMAAATGLRIASYFRPSSEIGGDIWGMLPINDRSFGVFLADFTGHGVTAALNTFRLHALIHEYRHLHDDPVGLLSALNKRLVSLLSLGQFATFLYVVIDHVGGRLRLASAGAPPPILMAGLQGSSQLVEASGAPLGIAREMPYQLHERPFVPGSMLLLFSDGLPENPDPRGERIGEDGLLGAIDACEPAVTPQQVIDRVCKAASIDANGVLPDDTTVICIDRRAETAARSIPEGWFGAGSQPRSADAMPDRRSNEDAHHAA
jgi:sigma-B regulation protein RsbU (phosphoserine phosphatase)